MSAGLSKTLEEIRGDVAIYARDGRGPWWACPGFWAVLPHRVGAAAHRMPNRGLRLACLAAYKVLASPWRVLRGVEIPHNADIGPGLRLPHPHNIFIAPGAKLGRDCSLYHEVTIGRGSRRGVPRIGDRVMTFPGSRVLGGIQVGNDARIGANVVVQTHVPPGASVSVPRPRVIPGASTRRASAPASVPIAPALRAPMLAGTHRSTENRNRVPQA